MNGIHFSKMVKFKGLKIRKHTSDKNGSVFDLGLVYFAGVEFYLTFQIDVSCGQDSFIKVRIQSSHGHIEFWMIRYNLIWRLALKNQGRDDHIFLMQFVSGHVYTGPGL